MENIRIPSDTGATPGRFDLTDHPFLADILDAVDDFEILEITFKGCTQIGKTETERAIVLSQGEVARSPMMAAGPDEIYAVEQRDEIYARALASPRLAGRVPKKEAWNKRHIDLERARIYLAWSGSTQRLSGRACKVVLASECDRWQKPVSLVKERVKAFHGGTTFMAEGTPVGASAYLAESYARSDRRTFRVPCPHCGHYQELRFFCHRDGPYAGRGGVVGLKDESGKWLRPEEARAAAYYVCEKGCEIDNDDKAEMIRRGKWARDGERITRAGRITGTPRNPGRHAGFTINSLYARHIGFGDAAAKWLESRDSTEETCRFFNDWLGLPFTSRGKTPRWKDLGARLAGTYARGMVPRFAYFLTAGADVQARGVYYVVRAWGNQKTSALVNWGYLSKDLLSGDPDDDDGLIERALASDLAKLDAVLLQRFPIDGQNRAGLSALAVRLLGGDRGYRQTDVDRFVRAHPGPRVLAVFGAPKMAPGSLYAPMKHERSAKTGRLETDVLRTWGIETNAYKSEIADRWMADQTQPGAWWLPTDILTTEGGEDYLRQITAETRSPETVNGRKVVHWELISHGLANHYFDCEVYASALADMVIGNDWNATNWPQQARPAPPPTAEQPQDFSAR